MSESKHPTMYVIDTGYSKICPKTNCSKRHGPIKTGARNLEIEYCDLHQAIEKDSVRYNPMHKDGLKKPHGLSL